MRPNSRRWFAAVALLCATTWALAMSGGPRLEGTPTDTDATAEASRSSPEMGAMDVAPSARGPARSTVEPSQMRSRSTKPRPLASANARHETSSPLAPEAALEPAARAAQLERRWANAARQAGRTPWAAAAQAQMREALRRTAFSSVQVRALDCRGGMCRLEVESETATQARSFGQEYVDELALETYGVLHHRVAADGRHLTTVYLADNAELLATAEH